MNLSRFATRHIKAVLFVTVTLCIIGAWLVRTFPVAILPDITFPRIVVVVDAGERPSRVVEAAITRPLEEAIATVPGVNRIRSKTQRGGTEITVDFNWGTEMLTALQLVNSKIGEARSAFPSDTQITAERMNPTVMPIMGLSVRAKGLTQSELWNVATYTLRPRLTRVPGVARVVVQGGRVPEIAVEVNPQRLAAYRLSMPDVEQALTEANVTRAVGLMDRQFQQHEAIVSGETTDPKQLGGIVVTQRAGVPIYLRQLADIHPSTRDRQSVVAADGSESVLINIVRQPEANTVSVVEGVNKEIAALKSSLPAGADVHVFLDQSVLIREAIQSVSEAVLIGAILSVIVLLAFLGDWLATLVTAAIIPSTVLITFLLMRISGLTLNLMTLGALAIGIGLMIDDAIVVVENVFRHLSKGETPDRAVQSAAAEIAAPMISSTLTTIVVFLPLVLLAGVAGAFFTALAVTLTIGLMVSLILALLVSPSLCAAFLKVPETGHEHGRFFGHIIVWYEGLLKTALTKRWVLPTAAISIIALTVLLATRLGTGFMPTMDEGSFVLDYNTPAGTSLAESDRILTQIDRILKETPEVTTFSRRTGEELGFAMTEPNRGDYSVVLKPRPRRRIDDVMNDIRTKIAERVPGVDTELIMVLQDQIGDLAGAANPVEVKLFGEDQKELEQTAEAVASKLENVPGVVDVTSGVVEAGPDLMVRINPTEVGRLGLTPDKVADQMNAAMYGDVVTQILQGDRQIGVRVRYPAEYRSDLAHLSILPIRASGDFNVPLSALGQIERMQGLAELNRENQRRVMTVTGGIEGRDLGSVERGVRALMNKTNLPSGMTYVLGGQFESSKEANRGIAVVLVLAIVLVFAVMLFQFGSFTAPIVITLVMPLSMFGVAFGLWVTGTPLNVSSMMGAVMLVGIVVKNGILLLDRAQKAEHEGFELEEAVLQAGRLRLRPILMTTLTAILGLVPLSLGLGAGAEMQKPLAIAVIGGLSFSTVFTLLFAPLLYVALRRNRKRSQ